MIQGKLKVLLVLALVTFKFNVTMIARMPVFLSCLKLFFKKTCYALSYT